MVQVALVKGFRGEPVPLNAIGTEKLFITLAGKSGETQIRLRTKYVYQYNEELYQALQVAFDAKDATGLEEGWRTAKPFRCPESER